MSIAFVVMQIGDPELDRMFETVIEPAIESAGLRTRRVDRHNEGDLLKSEIVRFLNDSEIIVADLTNERPNVYLEVGYAMGVDKLRNLILTCRNDHLPGSAKWSPDGPKVHFDLAGYDILLWEPSELDKFREELEARVRRRRALLSPGSKSVAPVLDTDWVQTQRETASGRMERAGLRTYMEAAFGVAAPKPERSPQRLRSAASDSMIHTFGWPIGVMLDGVPECQPRPRSDGIVTEVHVGSGSPDQHYDYWALRRNGDFFLRKSLFEDQQDPTAIFFNTRIVRNTELLMYALRLYDRLGVDRSTGFEVELRYGGLSGRFLRGINRPSIRPYACTEDEIRTSFSGSLQQVEGSLTEIVKELTAPMLALFDFFELNDAIYREIVESYVDGRIT